MRIRRERSGQVGCDISNMFTSDISSYEISVAYSIKTKRNSRMLTKRRLEKKFPELPSIQNFAAYSETSKYDKQSTLT